MKSLTCAALAVAVLFASPSFAADAPAAPQAPATATVQLTAQEIQLYAVAIRMAASQCGADHEDGCSIGAQEKAEDAKLRAAATALQTPPKK